VNCNPALATVVRVPIEVPVMSSVVRIVLKTGRGYERITIVSAKKGYP
jgi:ACR3 family arsenite efflux pump ArsB